ncbi:hypothetical protein NDU88_001267 [Pleurodeles waltl]|uniref:Uncharacterized protein n=1 Tax=Pleurodeles waltl TaxID=8319 RepID=A0AAV7V7R2_PLEWA|nr:hypothetical protein NDU88_001267 [Pleurodeles waltl]
MGRVLRLPGQDLHVLGGRGQVRNPRPPRPVREASEVSPRRVLSPVASASPPDPLARTRVLSSFQLHLRPGRWGHGVRLLVWPRCPSWRLATAPVFAITTPLLRGIQGAFQSLSLVEFLMLLNVAHTVYFYFVAGSSYWSTLYGALTDSPLLCDQ